MKKIVLSFACLLAVALAQTTILSNTTVLPNTTLLTPAAGTGTFTAIQVGNCSIGIGASTCSATVGSSFTTNKVHIYTCATPNSNAGTVSGKSTQISSVNTGETLTVLNGLSSGQQGNGSTNTQQSGAIVLPGAAAGHATPIVITLTQTATSAGGFCYVAELTPSANAGNIGIDAASAFIPSSACTNCTSPTLTLSGTSDGICQFEMGASGYTSPSAVASPYNTNAYLPGSGNGMGFSCAATPANGNGASWTTTSVTPLYAQVAFGWNVTTFQPQMFQGFEGGSNGAAPTVATLTSGVQGWGACLWALTGTAPYATAASMPLINASGRLADGSSVAAGAGTLGVKMTGSGSSVANNISCSFNNNAPLKTVSASVNFQSSLGPTDTTNMDIFYINGLGGALNFEWHGNGTNRFVQLECSDSSTTSSGTVTLSANTEYTLMLLFDAAGGTHKARVYNTSGSLVGSEMTCASTATNLASGTVVGNIGPQVMTNTATNYFDSWRFDTNGTWPLSPLQ
jgi:hypothetical protein